MRKWVPIVVVLGLFGLAAALFYWGEKSPVEPKSRVARRDFPRHATREDTARAVARRTQPAPDSGPGGTELRDPFMTTIPSSAKNVLVLDTGMLLDTPLGHLMTACMMAEDPTVLSVFQDKLGFNPLADVERIAVFGPPDAAVTVVEGAMSGLREKLASGGYGLAEQGYGDRATIWQAGAAGKGGAGGSAIALWGDDLVLMGRDVAELQAAIDRLEGRAESGPPAMGPADAYGESYGYMDPALVAPMLPPELRAALSSASRIEFHADATEDLLLVTDVDGPDAAKMAELARGFGSALSVARFAAKTQQDQRLVELLDMARISTSNGSFRLETALPLEMMEAMAAQCGRGRQAKPAATAPKSP